MNHIKYYKDTYYVDNIVHSNASLQLLVATEHTGLLLPFSSYFDIGGDSGLIKMMLV